MLGCFFLFSLKSTEYNASWPHEVQKVSVSTNLHITNSSSIE